MRNDLSNATGPRTHVAGGLAISLLGPWVDATEDGPIITLQAGVGVVGTRREELRHLGRDLNTSFSSITPFQGA